MFDLSKINFIDNTNRTTNYSFVGLQYNTQSGKIDFYLPLGFEEFPQDSFETTKEIFFEFYKIFKKFQKNKIKNRDGNINAKGGFEFQSEDNETILLYSKINMFDTILDEFDEMEIYSFDVKRTSSKHIDYGQLDKYIDRAIFLEDNIIYLDEMEIQKDVLSFDTAELIEMFCYIYTDIKKALTDDEDIAEHIISFGINFKEKYLTYDSSLFEENSFEITKDILKERLEIIDKKSLLKDSIYDKYYEAIYTFLYGHPFFEGDDDIYWGIDNFAFVWEELCQSYVFKHYKNDVLYADYKNEANLTLNGHTRMYAKEADEESYPFKVTYGDEVKYLYPDLVSDNVLTLTKNQYMGNYKLLIKKKNWEKYEKKLIRFNKTNWQLGYGCIDKSNIAISSKDSKNDYFNQVSRDNDYEALRSFIRIIDYKYKIKSDIDKKDIIKQKFYELAYGKDKVLENKFILPTYKNNDLFVYKCEELDDGFSIEYWNTKILFKEYLDD
jgi:hypothetical protein